MDLIVPDFASEYGVHLTRDFVSWREFRFYLGGLMQCDSRLWRAFAPKPDA